MCKKVVFTCMNSAKKELVLWSLVPYLGQKPIYISPLADNSHTNLNTQNVWIYHECIVLG